MRKSFKVAHLVHSLTLCLASAGIIMVFSLSSVSVYVISLTVSLNLLFIVLQSLVARLKENMEKLMEERDQRSSSENREKEQNKRMQRQIRDTKEEMGELAKKESEASRKKHELVTMWCQ